jgi:DNA polymerase III subunit gamma/tau
VFEQVYGHQNIIGQLQKDIERNELPAAILIHGNQYSGRMTTALESARALSCERVALGACDCMRCRAHRSLQDPYSMILSKRDHIPEIEAAYDTLKREKSRNGMHLFIRSVRLLLGTYHAAFLEVCTAAKRPLFELAAEIDDEISSMLEQSAAADAIDKAVRQAKKIISSCRKLAEGSYRQLPVSYIRSIASWLHSTSENIIRIVIIEGIDEFNDAAINSMLKILEEPPKHVHFILIARNRNLIIPTILSRVRIYYLGERDEAEQQVIEQVYADDAQEYDSLKTFFAVKHGVDCRLVRKQAEDFIFTAMGRRIISRIEIEKIITEVLKRQQFLMFFSEIAAILEEEVADGFIPASTAQQVMRVMADLRQRSVTYHQGDALLMETLFYRISEAV